VTDAAATGSLEPADSHASTDAAVEPTVSHGVMHGPLAEFTLAMSGPLPPPEVLAAYERLHPGAAERIIRMAEKSLDHTIEVEKAEVADRSRVMQAEVAVARRAQVFTFVLVSFFLVLSGYALYQGQGSASIGAGLAALGVIAYALRAPAKDRRATDANTDADESPSDSTADQRTADG
jgi:uncharacterized membrane protein